MSVIPSLEGMASHAGGKAIQFEHNATSSLPWLMAMAPAEGMQSCILQPILRHCIYSMWAAHRSMLMSSCPCAAWGIPPFRKQNNEGLAQPGLIEAASHIDWPSWDPITWDTRPVQACYWRGRASFSSCQHPPPLSGKERQATAHGHYPANMGAARGGGGGGGGGWSA